MRTAAYARVSTPNQVQTQSIEQQLDRLRAHAQREGWELRPENVFRDDGFSGASLNRPGLDALRDRAKAGEVDQVLIITPDRLARKYVHQALLLEEFEQLGCPIVFLDRPMSHDPHDQLLLQIRGAVAEYERTLIADRMRRGRQARLRAGTLLPWTHLPYGYRVDPARPRDPAGVSIDPVAGAIVRELFGAYLADGATLGSVAQALHRQGWPSPTGKAYWRPQSIRVILGNPTYTGRVYAGRYRTHTAQARRSALHPIGRRGQSQRQTRPETWQLVTQIPALVSLETFEQVQSKLAKNQQLALRNNHAHSYLLRGLVGCGHCRTACTGRGSHGRYYYYVCRTKGQAGEVQHERTCPGRLFPAQQLDELVWADVCEVLTHPEQVGQALARAQTGAWLPQELQARRENLRRGQASLERQLERLGDAYLHEAMPLAEYQRRRHSLEQQQQAVAAQATQLEAQVDRQMELARHLAAIEDFSARAQPVLAQATFEQKRHLVELLIDQVIVTGDEVEIRYVIPLTPASELTRFCQLRQDY
jgi:site-specific DNA recombinase